MAKREDRPRNTGDSKMKLPPCLWAAITTRAQLLTIAFARMMTVAGRPPSFCGTPIGCSAVQRTEGLPVRNVRLTKSNMGAMPRRRCIVRQRR
eukprot:6181726-Pleurochrysis_carterae.AAC.1